MSGEECSIAQLDGEDDVHFGPFPTRSVGFVDDTVPMVSESSHPNNLFNGRLSRLIVALHAVAQLVAIVSTCLQDFPVQRHMPESETPEEETRQRTPRLILVGAY